MMWWCTRIKIQVLLFLIQLLYVLEMKFQGRPKVKPFLSCHTHFCIDWLFLNLSAKVLALFVRLSCVPQFIMVVFKHLNYFIPLFFIICLTEVWLITVFLSTSLCDMSLPELSSCEQIKFSNKVVFSSVVIVRCLPEPALLSKELSSWNLFKSL